MGTQNHYAVAGKDSNQPGRMNAAGKGPSSPFCHLYRAHLDRNEAYHLMEGKIGTSVAPSAYGPIMFRKL